jgi:hypothetical protein
MKKVGGGVWGVSNFDGPKFHISPLYWGKFFTKTQNIEKSFLLSESSSKELQNEL